MSKKQFIKRHLLIVNKLKKVSCSFSDLQKYLQLQSEFDEENYMISSRTLQRDILEIKSLFGIEIKFNRKEGVYEIIEENDDLVNDRLFETFTILNTLKLAENFSDEIVFEQRKSLGLENIFLLVHAIKNQYEISFSHKKYWEENTVQKTFQPFFIKESKNRWYVVGIDNAHNEIRTFGLDRISNIELLKTKYIKPSKKFLKNLFQNSFGIIYDQNPPQKIILEFSSFQANYIKSLRLHSSQKIVSDNENRCKIELFIYPTYDFIMEILSMGKEVKVIEPQSLVLAIKQILTDSLKNY